MPSHLSRNHHPPHPTQPNTNVRNFTCSSTLGRIYPGWWPRAEQSRGREMRVLGSILAVAAIAGCCSGSVMNSAVISRTMVPQACQTGRVRRGGRDAGPATDELSPARSALPFPPPQTCRDSLPAFASVAVPMRRLPAARMRVSRLPRLHSYPRPSDAKIAPI